MGDFINNEQRPYQLLANPGFIRIVDRPMGAPENTYSFEYAGKPTRQMLTKQQDRDLVASAKVGFPGFASVASNTLAAWPGFTAGQKQDAWKLYELQDVRRWAEVHQESPPIHIPAHDITQAQEDALEAAALQGFSDFSVASSGVWPSWWPGLTPARQDGFWRNYEETAA